VALDLISINFELRNACYGQRQICQKVSVRRFLSEGFFQKVSVIRFLPEGFYQKVSANDFQPEIF
jgi:hypothetical protein